ncbi:glycosyltransferase [Cytobacillus oceanisediminis]|uniref:glycosyltransferase n=1 Tax=Cytobacillus oceanisediminis TaxID=665099 RepID=UPI0031F45BFF
MVSIITCTIRDSCMENIFENYERQIIDKKELIIILNNDEMKISEWQKEGKRHQNVSIYQLPEKKTLGECLNFAIIEKAKHHMVAKFDDDDYYSPYYLKEALQAFQNTEADIVGKRSIYAYLEGHKALTVRTANRENKFTGYVMGSTFVMKKEIFKKVKFPRRNRGEDSKFQRDCNEAGLKIYSSSKYNYTCIRRNPDSHTWKIKESDFLKKCSELIDTENYKEIVSKDTTQLSFDKE